MPVNPPKKVTPTAQVASGLKRNRALGVIFLTLLAYGLFAAGQGFIALGVMGLAGFAAASL